MKRFALAGLLRVRTLEEKQAAAELAESDRALDAVESRRARTRASLAGVAPGAVDAASLSAIVAARASAAILLGELSAMHERAAQETDGLRAAHHQARTRSLALEKLQTRHEKAEIAGDLRAEQAALDEIALRSRRTHERGRP